MRIAPLLVVLLLGLAFSASAQAAGGTAKLWGYGPTEGMPVNETSGCYCVDVPTEISGLTNVVQIAAGYAHGLALLDDGTVMSWGRNDEGQLGDGTETDRPTPVPIPGLSNVIAVAGAENSSLALLADGSVWAWGDAEQGNLGSGNLEGPEECDSDYCSKVPIAVPGVSNAIAISQGDEFSLVLRADGTVLAWGANRFGMLGDGVGVETGCQCIPSAVQIAGLFGVVAISAGEEVASALLIDGSVRNWGYNKEGELGIGTVSSTGPCFCATPAALTGVSGARQVATGGIHGFALLSSGALIGWGGNEYGQVGLGFASEGGCKCIATPTQVPNIAPQTVSAGYGYSLALISDGTGQSWGDGYYGELSNGESGNNVERHSPGPILGIGGASEISAGEIVSLAIVGPSQTLEVKLAGAGSGRVGGENILCPPSCSTPKPQGQPQMLRAESNPGTGFAGFSGPCTGTGACQVKMTGDQTVTATFGPPKGTRITKATIKSRKKKATFSFTAPGATTGYQCLLTKPKAKKKGKRKGVRSSAKKGKKAKPKFSRCKTPRAYKKLKPGRYTFKVRGLNILGADATPAVRTFKIKKAKPRKRRG
jgi:alpha-tubulin suppressor-like RCC1 family protein